VLAGLRLVAFGQEIAALRSRIAAEFGGLENSARSEILARYGWKMAAAGCALAPAERRAALETLVRDREAELSQSRLHLHARRQAAEIDGIGSLRAGRRAARLRQEWKRAAAEIFRRAPKSSRSIASVAKRPRAPKRPRYRVFLNWTSRPD
jgi:hypothetical protein